MHHSCTAVRYLRVADSGAATEREAAERAAQEAAARHAEELGRLRADVSAAQAERDAAQESLRALRGELDAALAASAALEARAGIPVGNSWIPSRRCSYRSAQIQCAAL